MTATVIALDYFLRNDFEIFGLVIDRTTKFARAFLCSRRVTLADNGFSTMSVDHFPFEALAVCFIPEKFAILRGLGLSEGVARDLCHPHCHDDRGGETACNKCPVLPAVFYRSATGSCRDGSLASSADVNVEKSARHHADPARQYVRPESHTCKAVKVIAEVERNHRTEPKQEDQLRALFADRTVDVPEFFISLRDRFDSVARDETGNQKG